MGRSQSKLRKSKQTSDELELKLKKVKSQRKRINLMESEPIPPPQIIPQNLTKDKYEILATDELRKQLKSNFSSFLLNQLLLSLQFYSNFEREKLDARQKCRDLEETFNGKLLKYSIILPNVLDQALEEHIHFQQKHGSRKNQSIKLHTQTMYMVFENLEISKQHDTSYDVVRPKCKIFIDIENIRDREERKKLSQGYVRLKFTEATRNRISIRNNNALPVRCIQIYPDSDESFHESDEDENQLKSQNQQEQLNESYISMDYRNSTINSGDYQKISCATYDYSYITNLNTHQPLRDLTYNQSSFNSELGVLPDECITNVVISQKTTLEKINDDSRKSVSDTDSDTGDDDFDSDTEETELLHVRYLSSVAFFKYFGNVFEKHLLTELGMKKEDWNNATFKGVSIYTPLYEIIPALNYPQWPECAYSWKFRERNTHINPFNGEKMQWPTPEMVRTVQSFGCHAIPLGYAPKKGRNTTRDLEWKIVFPEAERYLESNLSSTQVKVYMLCKALIKTFIEPEQKNDVAMFSLDHLRTHLFWSCEQNYAAWPPEFLGEALLRFLKSFLNCLSKKYLPDYFIPERNLIENIPENSIVLLYQIIFQIIQNPVMHIMMAYRNLRCDNSKFYPKLNYKELYFHIVIEDPRMAAYYKSENMNSLKKPSDKREEKPLEYINDEIQEPEGLIGYLQNREKFDRSKRRRTRKLKKQEELKLQKKLEKEQIRRGSEDSIDLQFLIKDQIPNITENRSTPEEFRRALIIEIFTKYFITMAKTAYKFESYDQCKIYLNQASRLCEQLSEYHCDESAKKFLEKINKIKETLKTTNTHKRIKGPALPLRINLEPVSSLRRNNRFDSGNDLNKDKIKPPDTPTKVVQFKEDCNFIEPREFFVDADVHSFPQEPSTSIKEITKLNGILKLSAESTDTEENFNESGSKIHRQTGAVSISDEILKEKDTDSINCTEF